MQRRETGPLDDADYANLARFRYLLRGFLDGSNALIDRYVGAGAMQPVAMTIIADLFPARERGKVQGYLASVWATSAVIGPLAGGVDYFSFFRRLAVTEGCGAIEPLR